jgi:hypothetical protein
MDITALPVEAQIVIWLVFAGVVGTLLHQQVENWRKRSHPRARQNGRRR